uniref:lytic transglycosylase domain-containing protein n=1 Tax=Scandinavium goeteborgense TaxID=1851514 RepID=UPI00135CE499|nr:lytic transglycosylase domain-containing protein [Scandinavium goeteborgense]
MRFSFQHVLLCLTVAGTMLTSVSAQAFCFNEAGARYRVDPLLLRAIARVESGMNPGAIGKNMDGKKLLSRDFGLMQINDRQIPQLRAMGVLKNEQELLDNPCLNVQIGAWILAKHLQQCGVNWECLGSYNAGFAKNNTPRRMIYARKIYATYMTSRGGGS